MIVMGIDPGLTGGLAVINTQGVWMEPMPRTEDGGLDLAELSRLLHDWSGENVTVYLEEVFAPPHLGAHSMLQFGKSWGVVRGMLHIYGFPTILVTAQKWQKVIYAGAPGTLIKKQRSEWAAEKLFPSTNFVMLGHRKPHLGMIEAALIAEYGRRENA